jgi:hypothetical protein
MVKCNKQDTESSCKSFKVDWSEIGWKSSPGSYFKNKTVGLAAKKFGSRLFSLVEKDPAYAKFKKNSIIKMIVKETTRGSAHKSVFYRVSRVELPTPVTRTLPNGVELTTTHKIVAKRCNSNFEEL